MNDALKAGLVIGSLTVLWALQILGPKPVGAEQPVEASIPAPDVRSGASPVVPQSAARPAVQLSPGAAMFMPGSAQAVRSRTPEPQLTPVSSEPPVPVLTAGPPSPSRVELRSFASTALDRGMAYFIYLPEGYDTTPDRRYPALYLLHGIGGGFGHENGSNTEWYGYGVTGAANDLIPNGLIQPLLLVLPQGDQSFWMDHADDGARWGQYTASDVVTDVDAHFRTIPDRAHRAIGGISMGGFGALELAMLYPETFGAAGAHSASLYKRDAAPFFGDEAFFGAHDPVHLLHDRSELARSLSLWLDVGSADPLWLTANEALHQQLTADGIRHEWHEWPGEHNGLYWHEHMPDYLRFYSAWFEQSG